MKQKLKHFKPEFVKLVENDGQYSGKISRSLLKGICICIHSEVGVPSTHGQQEHLNEKFIFNFSGI